MEDEELNRKFKALGFMTIIALAGTTVLLVVDPYGLSFHSEMRFSTSSRDAYNIQVGLLNLRDCRLSVSFVNDTDLIYRMNIVLFTATLMSSAFKLTSRHGGTPIGWFIELDGYLPMRSLDLVLGMGLPYDILITGTNLTSKVVYGNGSRLTWVFPGGNENRPI